MMKPALILLTALSLAPSAPLLAVEFHVDAPRGNDGNPGTVAQPFRTISKAAALAQAGDTVRIATGAYRESVSLDKSGTAEKPLRFEAAPAANVVVTGADRITDWRKETSDAGENVYSTPWPHRFITWSRTGTHPADDYHRLIGRAEQVFIDGYPLRQVLSRDKLTRGTFFADLDGQRLYVQADSNARLDQNSERVEASVRSTVWDVNGDHVHTRGITFRYGATQAQQGLVRLRGRGNVVEDCVFERANSEGADFRGPDQVVRRCVFQDNGQELRPWSLRVLWRAALRSRQLPPASPRDLLGCRKGIAAQEVVLHQSGHRLRILPEDRSGRGGEQFEPAASDALFTTLRDVPGAWP